MSSKSLENSPAREERASERLLSLLKTRGPQTAAVLGEALGSSDEAARQHLVKLAAAGVVENYSQARGVGRPAQFWRLTAAGHARFPDAHAALTAQLLANITGELGTAAMDKLLAARQSQTVADYAEQFRQLDNPSLEDRVALLAEIRSREGYMAEYFAEEDGFLLVENHCPISCAAHVCSGFCGVELNIFREVLGSLVSVERVEHILAGARRCAYRIWPAF
jgi:predicted ArsR family transcriptional regulator